MRARLARRSSMCTAIGPKSANRAAARKTSAVGTSQNAITAKIANGAAAAIATCGRYWPKKVCNCSTPSTTVSMMPPLRWLANHAGPSATMRSYSLARSVCWIAADVRFACTVRQWSKNARSSTIAATHSAGTIQSRHGAPSNTRASSWPRKT
ncbi:hypothetical protein D3C86_782800 [compost metagenome]